jgi:hypothetical protein
LNKIRHGTHQVQIRDIDVLSGRGVETLPKLILIARPGSNYNDGDVSGLRSGNCCGESRLIG